MSLEVSADVIANSDSPALARWRDSIGRWSSREVSIPDHQMTDEVLEAISEAAGKLDERSLKRVVDAVLEIRQGNFDKKVPSIKAAESMFLAFLREDITRGWLWNKHGDGHLYAWLVTAVKYRTDSDGKPFLKIDLIANGMQLSRTSKLGRVSSSITLHPEDIAKKDVASILQGLGYFWESDELCADYDLETERYRKVLTTGFSEQFDYAGTEYGNYGSKVRSGRIIHDIAPGEVPAFAEYSPSSLFESQDGVGEVPIHPLVRVFDLRIHDYFVAHAMDMTEYAYDEEITEKLVLPDDQRELLNILTTDIEVFTGDIIEGKSSGNVILCKGGPGLGKTLSAEVYSEIIRRPLYSIHSGVLGTSPSNIRENLQAAFDRTKRWNAVLLLDEVDVFVLERRENITQNAIVAEFLRTMEYFDGLMFMTTNRPDDIDDAILSRCAAIIDYKPAQGDHARKVWRVLGDINGLALKDDLVDLLIAGFPDISGRDIKMLLRLVLKIAAHRKRKIDVKAIDLFGEAAIFRGLHMHGVSGE